MNVKKEPSAMEVFISLGVIILVLVTIFYFLRNDTIKIQKACIETGIRTVALYSYSSTRTNSSGHNFEFKVEEERYWAYLKNDFVVNPEYPYKEVPIYIAYLKSNPQKNVSLMNTEFRYRDYLIIWKKPKDAHRYYMHIKRVK